MKKRLYIARGLDGRVRTKGQVLLFNRWWLTLGWSTEPTPATDRFQLYRTDDTPVYAFEVLAGMVEVKR